MLDSILQQQVDSLKSLANTRTIFPFNPNYISDQRGYFLGLSPAEIDRLHRFRSQGKWINTVREFQKVTQVDSQWLATYSAYFNFPSSQKVDPYEIKKVALPRIDLNKATAQELQQISGIGEVLSKRILRYRNHLQGFSETNQLSEVYGLSPEVVDRVTARCSLITPPFFAKISLQKASLDALAKIPYLTYQEARAVIRLRTELGEINLSNLHSIKGFDSLKIKRITLYLF